MLKLFFIAVLLLMMSEQLVRVYFQTSVTLRLGQKEVVYLLLTRYVSNFGKIL